MSILDYFFKKSEPKTVLEKLKIEPLYSFGTWNGNAYSNDIYRAAVDSISKHVAKLKASHIINSNFEKHYGDCHLNSLLQVRPNKILSSYDFLYLISTHLFLNNNSYILIQREGRSITGFYPIMTSAAEFLTDDSDNVFVRFYISGKSYVFSYDDLIIIRRHQNSSLFKGDSNTALNPAIELAVTQNEGIINGIKSGANIRGILKYNANINQETLRKAKDDFVKQYLSEENTVIATASGYEYIPLNNTPVILDADQSKQVKEKIYSYLGINEQIVNGSYDEDVYAAFYKSTIEPIAIQIGQEFTAKVFNQRERAFGNSIIFESDYLNFMSNKTKVSYIKELMPLGLLTINEARAIMNLEPVENGEKRLQTLNVANTAIVDQYQLKNGLSSELSSQVNQPDAENLTE